MVTCLANGCSRSAVSKGCCDKHYRRLLKRGNINDPGSRSVAEGDQTERFHQKYNVEPSGCWIWTGGSRPNGKGVPYPRHWSDSGKSIGAHRFSFELHNGPIPKGMYVCHKCDTPMCVNPDHLFIGTHHDNMRDMVEKGRSFNGRGQDKKGRAKLTNAQAQRIREMEQSHTKIAEAFGVSASTIGRIKRQESY